MGLYARTRFRLSLLLTRLARLTNSSSAFPCEQHDVGDSDSCQTKSSSQMYTHGSNPGGLDMVSPTPTSDDHTTQKRSRKRKRTRSRTISGCDENLNAVGDDRHIHKGLGGNPTDVRRISRPADKVRPSAPPEKEAGGTEKRQESTGATGNQGKAAETHRYPLRATKQRSTWYNAAVQYGNAFCALAILCFAGMSNAALAECYDTQSRCYVMKVSHLQPESRIRRAHG